MTPVTVVALSDTRKDVAAFVRFAETVYRNNRFWVPPLVVEQKHYIRSGPFNRFGEKQLFMAYRGTEPVARLSVHRNFAHNKRYNVNQGFFGFFEAKEDSEGAHAVFEAGERWLKDKGCVDLLGPMSFSIYEEIGLLVDGFEDAPVLLCPYNPPYYANLLEQIGFRKEIDWYGYKLDKTQLIPPAMERIYQRVVTREGVSLQPATAQTWKRNAAIVRRIFDEAWSGNWGHVPFDDAHWATISKQIKLAVLRDLSWFVYENGEPVGFLIVVKDFNVALREARGRLFPLGWIRLLRRISKIKRLRILIMGFLEPYRARGYDLAIAYESLRRAQEQGYELCDCSQIVEDNDRLVKGLEVLGAERYKTFRIYRKAIDVPLSESV